MFFFMLETKKDIIVVKLGTNVITREHPNKRGGRVLDRNVLADLVEEICLLSNEYSIALVSSGAVAVGREKYGEQHISDTVVRDQVLAMVGQPELMKMYQDFFAEYHQIIGQALLRPDTFTNPKALHNSLSAMHAFMKVGIPIINENDVEATEELTFGDNDSLAAHVAISLRAKMLLLLSDIDGVFDTNPDDPDATLLQNISVHELTDKRIQSLDYGGNSQGKGGIRSKLIASRNAAKKGVPAIIANGKTPNILQRILNRSEGTMITEDGEHFFK